MNEAWLLNTLWMGLCRRETRAFVRATRDVQRVQMRVLRKIVTSNRDTEFGREHQFHRIDNYKTFTKYVPTSRYSDYVDAMARIGDGQPGVLTSEPVRLFEPTSGTSGGEKLIPYTDALQRQFHRGVAAWIGDLFRRHPAVRRGRAYWSISPAFGESRRTNGGIPIGFDDDTAYLGSIERQILGRLLVVPPNVVKTCSIESFRYLTLLHLLRASDLALISIWSPTFLTMLLSDIERWIPSLCQDIRDGHHGRTPDAARADDLEAIFRSRRPMDHNLRAAWPKLAMLSCWTDAAASSSLPQLRRLMPHVPVQPKGLIATEAMVSFPLCGCEGGALAIRSHFFEFEELEPGEPFDGTGRIQPGHQLRVGTRYRVLVTTGGGLYRYHLGDVVEVTGYLNQCPLIRFCGRAGGHCDLVGEKLSEAHVHGVIQRSVSAAGISASFAMLAPHQASTSYYQLYLQAPCGTLNPDTRRRLEFQLEEGLAENPYYRYAIALGQLAPARLYLVGDDVGPAWEIYQNELLARGRKLGDIKPMSLDPWPGWADVFQRSRPVVNDK